jgi:hypothetical protein
LVIIYGCNNKSGETKKSDGSKTDSSIDTIQPPEDGGTEKNAIPVYAIWIPQKNTRYDGLYDSTSGYIRLCENKEVHHIDHPNQIIINPDNKCFSETLYLETITINNNSGAPLFLTVLHVDSTGRKLVGLTATNDTITTSVSTMNHEAFEKLKAEYRTTPFQPAQINEIKKYYSPEMRVRNIEKKEKVMKMKAVIKR